MSKTTLSTVLRILRAEAFLQARIAGALGAVHGISLNEAMLMMNLVRVESGRMRRVDLAQALGISQASVTRAALPLEKLGLVARDSDARDARIGLVRITDAGRQRILEAETTLERSSEQIFADRWTEAEVAELGSLLGRLTANLPGPLNEAA